MLLDFKSSRLWACVGKDENSGNEIAVRPWRAPQDQTTSCRGNGHTFYALHVTARERLHTGVAPTCVWV